LGIEDLLINHIFNHFSEISGKISTLHYLNAYLWECRAFRGQDGACCCDLTIFQLH